MFLELGGNTNPSAPSWCDSDQTFFKLAGYELKYSNGNDVRVGDKVKVSPEDEGVVVCSLDDRNFSPSYPEEEWGYLNVGVVIVTNKLGVVHYKNLDEDIELIERKCKR